MRDVRDAVLPPAGLPRRLATQSALLGIGSGTYLTGSVVFFPLYVGPSPPQVGLGFSAAGLIGLIGSLPLGHLADRIGGRRAWVLGALVLGPAALTFLAIHTGGWSWWLIAGIFAVAAAATGPIVAWVARTPRNAATPVPQPA